MIQTRYNHEFCMECGRETDQEKDTCECGSRNFIYGNHFSYENKKAICECGNDTFKMVMHMNMSPIHNKSYQCSDCEKNVMVQTYIESYC